MQGTYQTEKSNKWKRESIAVAIVLLICTVSLSTATAQKSVNSTGSNATGSGGTVSYSVGQVAYQTYTGTNGSVAEGVQQPYEISVIIGIERPEISLDISAYPNPTTGFLTLNINDFEEVYSTAMQYQLFNMKGELLQSKEITENETKIEMHNYVPAIYFVRVLSAQQPIKEFKVIKM